MSFKDNLYEVVRGVLHPSLLQHLDVEFELIKITSYIGQGVSFDNNTAFGDNQVKDSFSHYSPFCFEALSLQLLSLFKEITNKNLEPAYSYARIYYNGAVMEEHIDRPSCDYSATICISNDPEPWDIWFEDLNKNRFPIVLEPGDLIVYKGDVLPHWRDTYTGKRQVQAFLHYVDSDGPNAEFRFDKRPYLGFPSGTRL